MRSWWLLAGLFILLTPTTAPQLAEIWRGLTIAPESRCTVYDSKDYSYPQSVEDQIIAEIGGVYSPYTAEWFADKYETDIEHIVARSEAHDSGLCSAGAETRRRFARDLRNLTLASPNLNRYQKRAKDAAEWLPASNRCWFAHSVLEIRRAYGLTIDLREARALDAVLANCESKEMQIIGRAAQSNLRTQEADNKKNCGPYKNCTELRKVHPRGVPKGHCAYQSRMDRDKDGWACER